MRKIGFSLIPAAILAASPAMADPPRWQVTETTGTVQILRSGVSQTAIRGGMLYGGDVLVTSERSRAVVTRGSEYMIVSPGSRLRLPGDTRQGVFTQIIEEVGSVIYNVQRRNEEHFSVETPYLAAVVKGTTFSVTVGPTGSSVQVLEGLVEVSTLDGGASELVEPGVVALVGADDRYRLTVEGNETRVIDSPNAPETPVRTISSVGGPVVALTYPVALQDAGNNSINVEIRAENRPIGDITNGLLDGPAESDGVEVSGQPETHVRNDTGGENGNGAGNSGGSSNGNGVSNGNGGGNGTGDGNGTGGGNGNGGGNGSGPPEDPPGNDNGPPEDPPGNGNSPPEDPPGNGPPEDPPGTGNGPPEDPPGTGNGPPEDPPGTGNGPPEDPPGTGNGPPEDPPGNGNSPPEDPPGTGNGPPEDPPGNGNGPPEDPPGNGNGPPEDPPGNGNGPPEDPPGNGNGPPEDPPGNGGNPNR